MDRLQGLIFSFYREDLFVEQTLLPLLSCKITRQMGSVIDIQCMDSVHLDRVLPIVKYLKAPIGLLKLGRKIVIYSSDSPGLKYSVALELDKNLYV